MIRLCFIWLLVLGSGQAFASAVFFFSSRHDGVDCSRSTESFRYGRGNVFAPPGNTDELKNSEANVERILTSRDLIGMHHFHLQSRYDGQIYDVDSLVSTAEPKLAGFLLGDGLFTTQTDVVLLANSGDAHSLAFDSPTAVGIMVGSWRNLAAGAFESMLDCFRCHSIPLDQVTIHIGPGLGPDAYTLDGKSHRQLVTALALDGAQSSDAETVTLDLVALITDLAQQAGIGKVDSSQAENTFDVARFEEVQRSAMELKDPNLLIGHYRQSKYFSARLFTAVAREIKEICHVHDLPIPPGYPAVVSYASTGRNLNGIARLSR